MGGLAHGALSGQNGRGHPDPGANPLHARPAEAPCESPPTPPPAPALQEGDLPLTWALSISVWDIKATTSLSLLFSLSCRPRGGGRDKGSVCSVPGAGAEGVAFPQEP